MHLHVGFYSTHAVALSRVHVHASRLTHSWWEGVCDLSVELSLGLLLEAHHKHILKQLMVLGLIVVNVDGLYVGSKVKYTLRMQVSYLSPDGNMSEFGHSL